MYSSDDVLGFAADAECWDLSVAGVAAGGPGGVLRKFCPEGLRARLLSFRGGTTRTAGGHILPTIYPPSARLRPEGSIRNRPLRRVNH
jgi:hypothetical protein